MNQVFRIPVLCALFVFALSACSADEPAFADISWQMRCKINGGCLGYPVRTILGVNGERGNSVSCHISEAIGSQQIVNLSVSTSDGFSVQVRGAVFPQGGGAVATTGCRVIVEEENTYEGTCGPFSPNLVQPCQISSVHIDGTSVTGTLFCEHLPAQADQTFQRELTGPGSATTPISFRLLHCEGG